MLVCAAFSFIDTSINDLQNKASTAAAAAPFKYKITLQSGRFAQKSKMLKKLGKNRQFICHVLLFVTVCDQKMHFKTLLGWFFCSTSFNQSAKWFEPPQNLKMHLPNYVTSVFQTFSSEKRPSFGFGQKSEI